MRILLVGGIYGKPDAYRTAVGPTPEIVLEAGLRARGHDVVVRSHRGPWHDVHADLIHVHHLSYGALAAADGASPFVFTAHLMRELTLPRRAALRFVVAYAHASIVLSERERRWQLSAAPADTLRPVIPNGVDPGVFPYRPPAPRRGTLELLYVGQLVPIKGVDYLLHAVAAAAQGLELRLRLVYQVDDEERRLRELAADLHIDAEFMGARRSEELAELYAQCHALVLPSTTEALPSVVTEALFVGRPVIATDVGAIAEQIGTFGRLVPARSTLALARAIGELAADYDHLAARATEASAAAVARYSVDAMIDAHERLYESVLATWSGRRAKAGAITVRALARAVARARTG